MATGLSGGHAENALPQRARAVIQCRMMPTDTEAAVRARLAEAVAARTATEARLAEVEEARARLERLLAQMRRDTFGSKSEKLDPDQRNLPFEE